MKAWGVAVDRQTPVVVDRKGLARVMGKGPTYLVLGGHQPDVCEPGRPLTYSNYKVRKVQSDGTFGLRNRSANGYYLVSVEKGKILADPY